ncbi:HAMP domain-containing histidine kinase [Allosediminivita pacifica]|uniref:HAMP domain-containing histidine kinase n=1 Tax=Allosediminivita pacifica TaxID=1267769 RepID=UPI000D39EAD9|nr:HAMP domain-containing histidine kinase [Allosediminivita pacifica]GGB14066.1 hypothetical protein GCM10011324_25200 [Allosediminivita pacifica]
MMDSAIKHIQAHVEDMRRITAEIGDTFTLETSRADCAHFSLDEMALDIRARLASRLLQHDCELELRPLGEGWGDPELISKAVQAFVERALTSVPREDPARIQLVKEEGAEEWSIGVRCQWPPAPHGPSSVISDIGKDQGADIRHSAPGLSISRWIARRHGGTVRVAEGRDGGVTLWLTVPCDPSGTWGPSGVDDAA